MRALGLALAVAAVATCSLAQSQTYCTTGGVNTCPGVALAADGNPAASTSQLSAQSASDIATAGQNVPGQATAAGFITSAQTQTLLTAISQTFIPGYTPTSPGTTASLLSGTPASAANVGRYAVVSDLFGGTNEVLRSGYTQGFGYYWRPQRTDYAASVTTSGGVITLTPLVNSPYIFLSGTLASNLSINLSTTNAWPGASFCVSNNLTLGLFNVNVTGTNVTTSMVQGASKCFYFDSTYWRPFG